MAKHTPATIKQIIADRVAGRWVADHDETGHHYLHVVTGTRVDSTTTKIGYVINKPHLSKWMIKKAIEWLEDGDRFARLAGPDRQVTMTAAQLAYTEERDAAGSTGTRAHDVAEHYIKRWIDTGNQPADIRDGFLPNDDPRAIASARSVERFFKEHTIEPIASEILVGSVKNKVAGTLDFLCFMDGDLTLVDFKTSNSVTDTYAIQVADYAFSFKEMTGVAIKKVVILWLSKDYDSFKVYNVPNLAKAYKAMKAVSQVYDWLNDGQVKLVEQKKVLTL